MHGILKNFNSYLLPPSTVVGVKEWGATQEVSGNSWDLHKADQAPPLGAYWKADSAMAEEESGGQRLLRQLTAWCPMAFKAKITFSKWQIVTAEVTTLDSRADLCHTQSS